MVAFKWSLGICFENSFEIRETGTLVKFSSQVSVNQFSNNRGLEWNLRAKEELKGREDRKSVVCQFILVKPSSEYIILLFSLFCICLPQKI